MEGKKDAWKEIQTVAASTLHGSSESSHQGLPNSQTRKRKEERNMTMVRRQKELIVIWVSNNPQCKIDYLYWKERNIQREKATIRLRIITYMKVGKNWQYVEGEETCRKQNRNDSKNHNFHRSSNKTGKSTMKRKPPRCSGGVKMLIRLSYMEARKAPQSHSHGWSKQ